MDKLLSLIVADTTERTKTKILHKKVVMDYLPSKDDIIFAGTYEFGVERVVFNIDEKVIRIELKTVYVAEYEDFDEKIVEFKKKGFEKNNLKGDEKV